MMEKKRKFFEKLLGINSTKAEVVIRFIREAKKEVLDDVEDTYNCEGIDSAIINRIKKRHLSFKERK